MFNLQYKGIFLLCLLFTVSCGKKEEPAISKPQPDTKVEKGQIGSGYYPRIEITPLADGGAYILVDDILYYGRENKLIPITVDTAIDTSTKRSIASKKSIQSPKALWAFLQHEKKVVKNLKAELEESIPAPEIEYDGEEMEY